MIKRKLKKAPKASIVEESKTENSLLDTVDDFMAENYLHTFSNENIVPEYLILPPDLTAEESRELGKYLHAFTQQRMWARTLLSQVVVLVKELELELSIRKLEIYKELNNRMAVQEKELHLRNDSIARPLIMREVELQAKLKTLDSYLDSLDDGIFIVSREITRRQGDFDGERREENISRKPFGKPLKKGSTGR